MSAKRYNSVTQLVEAECSPEVQAEYGRLQAELAEARRIAEAYRTVWEQCVSAVETCPNPDPLPWPIQTKPRPENLAI